MKATTPGYYVTKLTRCDHCNGKGAIKATAAEERRDWSQCGNCKGEGVTRGEVSLNEALVALGLIIGRGP